MESTLCTYVVNDLDLTTEQLEKDLAAAMPADVPPHFVKDMVLLGHAHVQNVIEFFNDRKRRVEEEQAALEKRLAASKMVQALIDQEQEQVDMTNQRLLCHLQEQEKERAEKEQEQEQDVVHLASSPSSQTMFVESVNCEKLVVATFASLRQQIEDLTAQRNRASVLIEELLLQKKNTEKVKEEWKNLCMVFRGNPVCAMKEMM
jgi:hypothetical protein